MANVLEALSGSDLQRDEFINYNFNKVGLVAVQHHVVGDLGNGPVNAHLEESFFQHLVQQFAVMTFPSPDHRRKQDTFFPAELPGDQRYHLFGGVTYHGFSRSRRVSDGSPGIQQAQEIVYLGDRSHRGTGVAGGGFLFNRYDRAQARNMIHVGTLQGSQELPRVGRKCFQVATLSLCMEGIEGE